MDEIAKAGTQTLWTAIAQMPPGIQISLLIMIAVTAMCTFFNYMLLKELRNERDRARDESQQTREAIHASNLAITVLTERVGK